jgi:hypothetical protein
MNMANDDGSFNKEMESDSLEWNVMQSPKRRPELYCWPAGL